MRMSNLFFQTLRDAPAEAEIASHQLMLRAAMIYPVAAGIFDFLPLGLRVKHKIEAIFREEMDAIGGQEVTLPTVLPAELWQRSGRWQQIGDDMARLKDRNGRDYCLGMTHEEVMADLASRGHQFLSPTPVHSLSNPDQISRRTAATRRGHPRARVHDERCLLI